jgi:dUTP pyrophosphatase
VIPTEIKFFGDGIRPPAYPGDAGMDLVAAEDIRIDPHDHAVIDTGTIVEIPEGYVGLVCSRSGHAAKEGVFVLNSPGVIDSSFVGTLKVILANLDGVTFIKPAGTKIAQLLLVPFVAPKLIRVNSPEEIKSTERGSNELGSSG